MTHSITIETQNDSDFALMKELAQRLGLHVKESHTDDPIKEPQQEVAFKNFVGSWQGEETADELVEIIYSARNDQPRDIDL
ncbi:hypothetical protein ACFSUS_10355 [Spirosoma soli]|uniref:Uncharacterized protein n=1 Tax=Spirosoma soli TaxID=1770529 RepID=A0ABW5M3C5_9BACT